MMITGFRYLLGKLHVIDFFAALFEVDEHIFSFNQCNGSVDGNRSHTATKKLLKLEFRWN